MAQPSTPDDAGQGGTHALALCLLLAVVTLAVGVALVAAGWPWWTAALVAYLTGTSVAGVVLWVTGP